MPAQRVFSKNVGAGGSPVNAAETIIFTTDPISTSGPGSRVRVIASGQITPGATTTSLTLKCYRGAALGGAQVGNNLTFVVAPGVNGFWAFVADDAVGDVAGVQYTIAITQNGGSANGATQGNAYDLIAD